MSDYPMLISNKLHSFRNFRLQSYTKITQPAKRVPKRFRANKTSEKLPENPC